MSTRFDLDFFDPLSTEELTYIICARFERQPPLPLAVDPPTFDGSGLYGIYYVGDGDPLYGPLVGHKIPVYVGQALSHNSATGSTSKSPRPLWSRVREHRASIEGAELDLRHFALRMLGMPDVHADLGENGLRVGYQPLWNRILTGFGSHEQGATTRQSKRSKWDTVHMGRKRTDGGSVHDPAKLGRDAADHIAWQIATCDELPWRKPSPTDETN